MFDLITQVRLLSYLLTSDQNHSIIIIIISTMILTHDRRNIMFGNLQRTIHKDSKAAETSVLINRYDHPSDQRLKNKEKFN